MTDVSVIGLGDMGSALAHTLLGAGYSVTVWNRSASKAEPLVAAGAELAASAREAIDASPATITCITSHDRTIEIAIKVINAFAVSMVRAHLRQMTFGINQQTPTLGFYDGRRLGHLPSLVDASAAINHDSVHFRQNAFEK